MHTSRFLFATLLVLICSLPMAVSAQSGNATHIDIPAGDMTTALDDLAKQSGAEFIYRSDQLKGVRTRGASGTLTADQALTRLLAGSGFTTSHDPSGAILIVRSSEPVQPATPAPQTQTDSKKSDDDEEEELKLERVTVTGTHIRGIAPDSSPTRTFTSEDIQISGAATAQDFIQTLTVNFGGGSNERFVNLPNDSGAGFNGQVGTFGSSVNLRGLGSGSTLVLLNGHRIAPSSGIGDFVDLSMIPASALERVEILTDGASSIYGADAVAGVVNFVVRDNYDGVETSLRYGAVTEGDMDVYRASITGGKTWNTGNALMVYEYFSQDNLSAEDRTFSQEALLPTDLLPSQERHSIMASATQELTPAVDLFADFLFSKREAEHAQSLASTGEGLPTFNTPSTQNLNISAGGGWKLSDTWFLDFSGTYSKVDQDVIKSGALNSVRKVDSDLWSVDAKTSGTLFSLPGGDVKLAVGGQYRSEAFASKRLDTDIDVLERKADRDVYAVFGEAFIPIVGPDNALPGIERLEINVSGQYADFSDFGSSANPKVGVLWSPLEALRLRGSYSTSFNPPPLGRVGATDLSVISYPSAFINNLLGLTPADPSIADIVIITVNGTDKNLIAEESRSFTGGFDFNKRLGHHHFSASATYFDIKYENRLGTTPVPGNVISFDVPNIWFNSPDAFPPGTVIFPATADQITELLDSADNISGLFGTDPLDAEMIRVDFLVRNLSLSFVQGFDFEVAYSHETDFGDLSFGLDGTYFLHFEQQAAVTTPIVERLNTQFNPVDLKLRGHAGYSHNGFAANIFVNYTDSYSVDETTGAAPINSWTTIDLSLAYETQEKIGDSILDNTEFRLSVLNLFDEDPPATPGFPVLGIFGYDPTNASPLNRFIAFEVTKRF